MNQEPTWPLVVEVLERLKTHLQTTLLEIQTGIFTEEEAGDFLTTCEPFIDLDDWHILELWYSGKRGKR